jgi:hypothetical protein
MDHRLVPLGGCNGDQAFGLNPAKQVTVIYVLGNIFMIHEIQLDHPPGPWITSGSPKIPLDGYFLDIHP